MKAILSIISFLFCFLALGQDMINQSRKLKHPTFIKEYNIDTVKNLPADSKFTIVGTEGEYYKVYFWNWNSYYKEIEEKEIKISELEEKKSLNKKQRKNLKNSKLELEHYKKEKTKHETFNVNVANRNSRYFLIPINEIDRVSTEIFNKVTPSIGVLSLPFKYRFKDRSFEPSFNMNLVGGIKLNPWDTNTHTISILGGIGASSVKITPKNTNESANVKSEIDAAAISLSLNLVYQFTPLQVGISYGVDNIFNNKQYSWNHQGKPWLSLAIGVDIFKSSKPAKPTNN